MPEPLQQDDDVVDVSVFPNNLAISSNCGHDFRDRMKELEADRDDCVAFWLAEWRACVLAGRGYWSDLEEVMDTENEPDFLELTNTKDRPDIFELRDTGDEVAWIDLAYIEDCPDTEDMTDTEDGPDHGRPFEHTGYTESWYGTDDEQENASLEQTVCSQKPTAPDDEQENPSSAQSQGSKRGTQYAKTHGQCCPYCRELDDCDILIGCDSCYAWIHLSCVGLSSAPKGDWNCPDCIAPNPPQSKKRKHFDDGENDVDDDDDDDDDNDNDDDDDSPPRRRGQAPKKPRTTSFRQAGDQGKARTPSYKARKSRKATTTKTGPNNSVNRTQWTRTEMDATIVFMKQVLDEKSGPHKTEAKWQEISDRLRNQRNIYKRPGAVKFKWKRDLRAESGIDERIYKKPNKMRTSFQSSEARKEARKKKKAKKEAADVNDESESNPPTRRRPPPRGAVTMDQQPTEDEQAALDLVQYETDLREARDGKKKA